MQARIGSWMRACAGAHEARDLRVIRFGDNMREVADTDGDKVEVQARFGTSVNTYPVNELVAVVEQVADAEVERLCAEYDEAYDGRAGAAPGGRAARRRCATRHASSWACGPSSPSTARWPSSTPSRTSAA